MAENSPCPAAGIERYIHFLLKIHPFFPPRYYNPLAVSLSINGKYLLAGFAESGIYMSTDNEERWVEKLVGKPRLTPYEVIITQMK